MAVDLIHRFWPDLSEESEPVDDQRQVFDRGMLGIGKAIFVQILAFVCGQLRVVDSVIPISFGDRIPANPGESNFEKPGLSRAAWWQTLSSRSDTLHNLVLSNLGYQSVRTFQPGLILSSEYRFKQFGKIGCHAEAPEASLLEKRHFE